MGDDTRNTENIWTDPDDAPELNHEFFERADEYEGHRLVTSRRNPNRPVAEQHAINQLKSI